LVAFISGSSSMAARSSVKSNSAASLTCRAWRIADSRVTTAATVCGLAGRLLNSAFAVESIFFTKLILLNPRLTVKPPDPIGSKQVSRRRFVFFNANSEAHCQQNVIFSELDQPRVYSITTAELISLSTVAAAAAQLLIKFCSQGSSASHCNIRTKYDISGKCAGLIWRQRSIHYRVSAEILGSKVIYKLRKIIKPGSPAPCKAVVNPS
jgi:hypothetical protein